MKKIICAVSVLMVSAVVVIGMSSFTLQTKVDSGACSDIPCQGKHCTYTVGCGCSGFLPKAGDVWEEAHCRRCGHHKRYHR